MGGTILCQPANRSNPGFFSFFFLNLSQSTPDHGPRTPIFKGKSPFSPQPSVLRTGGWHQSTGFFIARKTVPYSSACHVPPSLFIYITIPGAGGDSPAGLGGNDVIRRLLHVGRRRRVRHSTGILFARPPMPYSTISHAPFSRYSNFSHRNGGGIQQQLASPLPLPSLLPLPWTFWPLKGPVETPTEVYM